MHGYIIIVVTPSLTGLTIFGDCQKVANGLPALMGVCRVMTLVISILFCSSQMIPLVVKQYISVLHFGDSHSVLFCRLL